MGSAEYNAIMIGGRIDRLRNARGYSIEDLAERADLNKNTVNRVMKGIGKPNLDTFFKLCQALDVTPNDLMDITPRGSAYRLIRSATPDNLIFHDQEPGIRLGVLEDKLPHGSITYALMELSAKGSVKSHGGEELLFCMRGKVGMTIGSVSKELAEGDAILFHATEPHSYYNADPKEKVSIALCVMSISDVFNQENLAI